MRKPARGDSQQSGEERAEEETHACTCAENDHKLSGEEGRQQDTESAAEDAQVEQLTFIQDGAFNYL